MPIAFGVTAHGVGRQAAGVRLGGRGQRADKPVGKGGEYAQRGERGVACVVAVREHGDVYSVCGGEREVRVWCAFERVVVVWFVVLRERGECLCE